MRLVKYPNLRFAIVVGILVLAALALYAINFGVIQQGDPDEGVYLSAARLLNLGYPYSDFFLDQFALFPSLIASAFRIGGDNLASARALMLVFAGVGLLGITRLTRAVSVRWVAAAALVLTAVHPYYLALARYTMGEIPALAFMVWALVLVATWNVHGSRLRLVGAGALFAASLLIKPLLICFALPLVVWIVSPYIQVEEKHARIQWRSLAQALLLLIGPMLVVALFFVNLDVGNQFRGTVLFHLDEIAVHGPLFEVRAESARAFFVSSFGWWGLFLIGAVSMLRRSPRFPAALLVSELGTFLLLLQLPPFPHHYTLLVPILCLFAALGVQTSVQWLGRAVDFLKNGRSGLSGQILVTACLALFALSALVWAIPQIELENRLILLRARRDKDAVVEFVRQHTQPRDFVLSDDPIVVFLANRAFPPSALNLAYASSFQIDPYSLDRLDLTMKKYPLRQVVVAGTYHSVPALLHWVQQHFSKHRIVAGKPPALRAEIYWNPK